MAAGNKQQQARRSRGPAAAAAASASAYSKRRALHIGAETWSMWHGDVYQRYIVEDEPLKSIMRDYSERYRFHGT